MSGGRKLELDILKMLKILLIGQFVREDSSVRTDERMISDINGVERRQVSRSGGFKGVGSFQVEDGNKRLNNMGL